MCPRFDEICVRQGACLMNIGIIGYGKMGSAIFKLLASKHYNIIVLIRSKEKLIDSEKKLFKTLQRSLKRGAITEDDFLRKKESLRFTNRLEDLASMDMVIEIITESCEEKANIFRKLESIVDRNTVLVTNTSSISIESLAGNLKYKERFCGLHFFYPVLLIDLVEIIKWHETKVELIEFLKHFCKQVGKKPIVVLDAPGSVINAILAYYYVESLYILEEGLALPSEIDELAKKFFYIGPCESIDVVGIDFFIGALEKGAASGSLCPIQWTETSQTEISKEDLGGREGFFLPYLFRKLVSENRLGKKVSRGIYLYQGNTPSDDKPEFYINPARSFQSQNISNRDELVAKRLLYSIFNGSIYSLQMGMSSLQELDQGVKEVLHIKEGPFTMMKAMGKQKLKEEFDFLSKNTGKWFEQTSFDFF